jgi:hypothetical protein
MSTFSDFLENELLDHVWGNSAYVAPATLFIALSTTDPLDDNSGLTEPGGGVNYARASVTNNLTEWPAAVGGAKANGNTITFNTASGAGWGVIAFFAIMDAASAGNQLGHAALTASKTIDAGDTPSFAAGDIDITLD